MPNFQKSFPGPSESDSVMNDLSNKVAIKVFDCRSAQDGNEEQGVNITTNQTFLMFQGNNYNVPPPNYNADGLGSQVPATQAYYAPFQAPLRLQPPMLPVYKNSAYPSTEQYSDSSFPNTSCHSSVIDTNYYTDSLTSAPTTTTTSTIMTADNGNAIDSEDYIDGIEASSNDDNENIDNVKQTLKTEQDPSLLSAASIVKKEQLSGFENLLPLSRVDSALVTADEIKASLNLEDLDDENEDSNDNERAACDDLNFRLKNSPVRKHFHVTPKRITRVRTGRVSHNIIEKKYRSNINDKIEQLRRSVPTLRVAYKKCNDLPITSRDLVDLDGLEPATKLNKASILTKSIEYICHLERKCLQLSLANQHLSSDTRQSFLQLTESPQPLTNNSNEQINRQKRSCQRQQQQQQQRQKLLHNIQYNIPHQNGLMGGTNDSHDMDLSNAGDF
ncbi:hms1p [Saccharomyces arboricola H-6]|uniref:Hms1p n=1 Tax=Saccharomyces arboricola (strain H-6 / AS 2.3317 / CBS 10644) TaxID=1160507 RepID=J8PZ96_SACAR|nr:hms1p [Saccharomyces arboricola H-6]